MLIPSTYRKIEKGDYSILPFQVSKQYNINKSDLLDLGYSLRTGIYQKPILPISSSQNSVINAPTSSDGVYNYITWKSLNHIHYNDPYSYAGSYEGINQNKTNKELYITASYIGIPYHDMGEGISPNTINIFNDNISIYDDGNYNLYDSSIDDNDILNKNNLDAYWGFQNIYNHTKYGYSSNITCNINFESKTMDSEYKNSNIYNVGLSEGIEINNTGSGAKIDFLQDNSYVITKNNRNINYELNDDYTLSFWLKCPVSQSNINNTTNNIINKRYYKNVTSRKVHNVKNERNQTIRRRFDKTTIEYKPTSIYPYDISIYNETSSNDGRIIYRISDGNKVMTLISDSRINDGLYHHVSAVKSGSLTFLYIDGIQESSGSIESYMDISNDNHLIFGLHKIDGLRNYSGSLDEVRFYNQSFSSYEISSSLANKSNILAYQTKNIGNVFYKRGDIVITSPVKSYHNEFNNDWKFKFKNTYTIYEYEAMARIKACEFTRTMNPSATKSIHSDEYLDAMVTGSMNPYATAIGLYNDQFELVAIAKLGRPLKMRPDVNINLIVRMDY